MESTFLSINDAAKMYNVSSNTIRKIVKANINTGHVRTEQIKGKHGFKYLVSVELLNTVSTSQKSQNVLNSYLNRTQIALNSHLNRTQTVLNSYSNQEQQSKKQVLNENDNHQISKLESENKQLSKQIVKQNEIIDKLTDTISEQNKVIVSQSMQIHQLSERAGATIESNHREQKGTNIENFVIAFLIVFICLFLLYAFK